MNVHSAHFQEETAMDQTVSQTMNGTVGETVSTVNREVVAGRKAVLITGATTGIGRHAALYLAERGFHVIASGRKADLLANLVLEAAARGWRLDTLPLDVTDG